MLNRNSFGNIKERALALIAGGTVDKGLKKIESWVSGSEAILFSITQMTIFYLDGSSKDLMKFILKKPYA